MGMGRADHEEPQETASGTAEPQRQEDPRFEADGGAKHHKAGGKHQSSSDAVQEHGGYCGKADI
jgi:hypothetical protein